MEMNPKFCSQCGVPLPDGARFCHECGSPTRPTADAPQPAQSTPSESPQEPIVGMLPVLQQKKGFLGLKVESYSLLITPKRLALILVTSQMMKDAVALANQEAKAQGKGILGRMAAQMGWVEVLCRPYHSTSLDSLVQGSPGSWAVGLDQVKKVTLWENEDEESGQSQIELRIETTQAKQKFDVKGTSYPQARDTLRRALPQLFR